MSGDSGSSVEFSSLQRGRFGYLPVVPGRLEFAIEVRQADTRRAPQVVAIELPDTLEELLSGRHPEAPSGFDRLL